MSLKVLFLSRNYPNNVTSTLGLWVEGLVRQISTMCECRVIAPVPYCPPLLPLRDYSRFRDIALRDGMNGVDVLHPRFLTGPGYSLHSCEASLYYWGVQRHLEQVHREFPFDVIHAHFTYPDGVVAARLAQRYRVPVLITEHAPWLPWMQQYPRVRHQAVWASRESMFHIAVSRFVRKTITYFTGDSEKLAVIPVGVDENVFSPARDGQRIDPNQIIYVGRIHLVKGVDVLLKAMCRLIKRRPNVRLILVGGSFFRNYRRQEERLRRLSKELGLDGSVEFVGERPPHEVAELMRKSAVLVLPSRAESFGATLVEAVACGTPVVSTRCGGPEDIVTEDTGVLVPPEDEDALAEGIESVLEKRETYDPTWLRNYAVENFAWERIAGRTVDLYHEAMDSFCKKRM